MRYLLCFILLFSISNPLYSQKKMNTFQSEWKMIDADFQNNLNQSATQKIKKIIDVAKKEGNHEQYIKAICYLQLALAETDEESSKNNILFFDKEIKEQQNEPIKYSILNSILGDLIESYYQANRWKILSRTPLNHRWDADNVTYTDIDTWATADFNHALLICYKNSLKYESFLKKESIGQYSVLIDSGKNTTQLRPTLYDVLAFRVIESLSDDSKEITQGAYQYEMNDAALFSTAKEFCKIPLKTSDTTQSQYRALRLYQSLVAFHLNDAEPSALIDIDLLRLEFLYQKSFLSNKEALYIKQLKAIEEKYHHHKQAAKASFFLARIYSEKKEMLQKAIEKCSTISHQFPNSEAAYLANEFINNHSRPVLNLKTEKAILPDKPSLALLEFKNVSNIYFKIVPITQEELQNVSFYNRDYSSLLSKTPIKKWEKNISDKNDYLLHSTEIKIEALPLGLFAVLLSESKDFNSKSETSVAIINSSNLAYVVQTPVVGASTAYIVHRESGEPIANASLRLWKQEYDYKKQKYNATLVSTLISNAEGKVNFDLNHRYESYYFEVSKGNDHLYLNDYISIYNSTPTQTPQEIKTFIFTDRGLYRPNQLIYFKGIVLQLNASKKSKVLAGFKTQVILKDYNRNEVQKIDVTTNENGSFQGTFKAPEGLLNGTFTIYTPNGSQTIQIEEYKRPKFEVLFDTLISSYKLNETIQVKGKALAFSGNEIDGATVSYRVYRNARFPYYWHFYRGGRPQSPQREITHGKTTTLPDGTFTISFDALPDENIDKKTIPVFEYTIEADITDLNGETRSGSSNVSVSYQNLLLQIETPENQNIKDFKQLTVYASNLDGGVIPQEIDLSLKKLKSPQQAYRSRLWGKPEYYSISEKEFRNDFPFDEYQDENNHFNWQEEKTIWNLHLKVNQKEAQSVKSPNEEGWYVLEAHTIDKDKNPIVEKKYIRLYKENGVALPDEKLIVRSSKENAEPNEKINIEIITPYPHSHLIYESTQASSIQKDQWIHLEKTYSETKTISEADRGGFNIVCWYVKNNRFYSKTHFINIPWSNKDLNISLETYREKIQPGTDQEWTIKISGNKKEKVSAELLASMYDASLDAYRKHEWSPFSIFKTNYSANIWSSSLNFQIENSRVIFTPEYQYIKNYELIYPSLQTWGLVNQYAYPIAYRTRGGMDYNMDAPMLEKGIVRSSSSFEMPSPALLAEGTMLQEGIEGDATKAINKKEIPAKEENKPKNDKMDEGMIRSNLAETAFFFPQLQTNAEGNVFLKFKAPESLTRWKLMAFAHTNDLQSAYFSANVTTQKELMIIPNTPRFLREGDQMEYSAKVTNLSKNEQAVTARLLLDDALTLESLDDLFQNTKTFSIQIPAGESRQVKWKIKVPAGYTNPVRIRSIAQANHISDGEENIIPVVLNSTLVTETLPLPVRPNTQKNFRLENLLKSKNSTTIKNYQMTVEYTPNPAWYAIQSLPYLTEYPYECAEQTFNRYYANALAAHIANSNPKIKEVFSTWKEKDTLALLSNLSKNEELKSALLQETPWVLNAKNESEQKKMISTLLNTNRMSRELAKAVRELEIKQTINGGFAWFKGMPEDRFMTQYIVSGIGKLIHLGAKDVQQDAKILAIAQKAIPYLDKQLKKDYDELLRLKVNLSQQGIGSYQIQYLYMRSFFKNIPINQEVKTAFDFYLKKCATHWTIQSKYLQAMSSIALYRWDDKSNAMNIVKALRENAIHHEEFGMYWKENTNSYWWYHAPIETQSLMIELFKEVAQSENEVDELKVWLLKNKQTNHWKTTKATADACYALLLNGTYWLAAEPEVNIKLGNFPIDMSKGNKEAGSGYQKININGEKITPEYGNISVEVKSNQSIGTTWGAVYWQYFEQLDQIQSSETGLKLSKQLYKINHTDKGETLIPIQEGNPLHVGDKVKVRIELRVDRPYEYVHLKDMRAACFEPLNVISHYQYQGGLGYYESTKDLATHFFFHYLQKGVYVFEYPLFVTNKGDFSNGISTIQCMYAPEFSSHSEGIRVKVE